MKRGQSFCGSKLDGPKGHRGDFHEDLHWLRTRLLRWMRSHGRKYPWRETSDAYRVLVAEMLLRRTRADQVRPVYEQFVRQFPNVGDLAKADKRKVMQLLYPLGLYWRAKDVVEMAKTLLRVFGGVVPNRREELRRLPGVGDYVAGAVLSMAMNRREWIVDANVVRLFGRFFGLALSGEGRRHPALISLSKEYSRRSNAPGRANLALIDHAALICKPGLPMCSICPIRGRCRFLTHTDTVGG